MDKLNQDVCRSHSCRADKDSFRICPSQLSKRELEELYFTLLENNVDLKKTVNTQREKMRLMSTKLLRVNSTQKRHLCKTQSKCCISAHEVIEEQKLNIQDLQLLNSRMVEKIRQLNMKLCSQKQFRCSPSRSSSKYRCLSAGGSSRKNVIAQDSGTNLACSVVTARSQKNEERNHADQDEISNKLNMEKVCDENKCQSQISELKQKIVDLQEELNQAHSEYMDRIKALEEEVQRVQEDKSFMVRAAQATSQQNLLDQDEQRKKLITQLRDAESTSSSLAAELSVEKKRVIELRAQLKAAALAKEVIKMLEDHLMNVPSKSETNICISESAEAFVPKPTKSCMNVLKPVSEAVGKEDEEQVANEKLLISKSLNVTDRGAGKSNIFEVETRNSNPQGSKFLFQHRSGSDNSYFTKCSLSELETNVLASSNEETGLLDIIRQLMKKIGKLQSELDALKVCHTNTVNTTLAPILCDETPPAYMQEVSQTDIPVVNNITDYKCVIVDPTKHLIVQVDRANPSAGERYEETPDYCCSPERKSEGPCAKVSVPCTPATPAVQTNRVKEQPTRDHCCGNKIKSRTISKELNSSSKPVYAPLVKQAKAILNDTPVSAVLPGKEHVEKTALESVPLPDNPDASMLWKTYTVKGEAEVEEFPKSMSSTERDITSITYKTYKDGDSLSYGEERQISNKVDNCTSTEQTTTSEHVVTDNLFSDGEVPPLSQKRISYDLRANADAKTASTLRDAASNAPSKLDSTTFKVEETLRAISAELSKCRELLQTQKQTQVLSA